MDIAKECLRCIIDDDAKGLSAIVSRPDFDFDQFMPTRLETAAHVDDTFRSPDYTRTPLGLALFYKKFWAFEMLLVHGAHPDSDYIRRPPSVGFRQWTRPIEFCSCGVVSEEFLHCLFDHGASTCFAWTSNTWGAYPPYMPMLRAANARELRAYTAVWCANHAGGCWPDMAMLMQSVIMRDDITETPQKQRRTYLK